MGGGVSHKAALRQLHATQLRPTTVPSHSADSWVYKQMNAALRCDHGPVLQHLAPLVRGLINAYKELAQMSYSGTVYRRTFLSEAQMERYEEDAICVWAGYAVDSYVPFD